MSQPSRLDSSWKWDLPQQEVMPVHDAVRNKSPEMMQFLDDCDLDLHDNCYNTPLHVAVLENKPEWIEALVKAGASPDIKNYDKETPLELATRLNNQECIEAFDVGQALSESQVMFDSWIEIPTDRGEDTPLHKAISSKYEAVLIPSSTGWAVWKDQKGSEGNTPLHLAVFLKKVEWITALLFAKADPNIQNENRDTPIHVAARSTNNVGVLTLLIDSGAKSIKNNAGQTPLDLASDAKDIANFQILSKIHAKD